jgi:hypothetical protein
MVKIDLANDNCQLGIDIIGVKDTGSRLSGRDTLRYRPVATRRLMKRGPKTD